MPSPQPPRVRKADDTEENVEPIDLAAIAPELAEPSSPPAPAPKPPSVQPKPPSAAPRTSQVPSSTPMPLVARQTSAQPMPLVPKVPAKPAPPAKPAQPPRPAPPNKPVLAPSPDATQKMAPPRIAVVEPSPASVGTTLNTTEIAALPPPSAANLPVALPRRPAGPPPRGMSGLMPAVQATEEVAPIEISMRELQPMSEEEEPSSERVAPPKSEVPAADLVHRAKQALLSRDLPMLERVLAELETTGSTSGPIDRLRGLSAVARGDLGSGLALLRRARAEATDEREIARTAVAYAIALGAAGRRQDAIVEALEALAVEKRIDAKGEGSRACRRLIERLLA